MNKNHNALRVLAGDGFSAFGAWIDFLAILTLAAWQFQVSPLQMAAVSAAGLLPGIVAGPALGRWCDKGSLGDTRRILQGSIALRLLATGAILFCHDYLLFVLLVGLRSVFASVAAPAINVLALRVTAPDERPRFYAVLNVINNSAKVLAPALGTVSSSLASEALALMLSAACSAAALIAFAGVRGAAAAPPVADAAPHASPPPPAVSAASLLPLLWVAATCAFFVFMVNNLVPLVLQRSGFDKSLLGVLVSCSGAGNILSGLWLARRAASGRAAAGRLAEMLVPALCQAAGFAVIALLLWQQPAGLALQLPLILPLMFFTIGIFSARLAVAMNVHVATHHAARVGQVWGLVGSWQSSMILVAPLLGAVVLDQWGPAALFAFAAASAGVSLGLWGLLELLGVLRQATVQRASP